MIKKGNVIVESYKLCPSPNFFFCVSVVLVPVSSFRPTKRATWSCETKCFVFDNPVSGLGNRHIQVRYFSSRTDLILNGVKEDE